MHQGTTRDPAPLRERTARTTTVARRALAGEQSGYRTPAWLDRSFVLPVSPLDALPDQSRGEHDTLSHETAPPSAHESPEFVRPPSEEIDFGRVVARTDACRRARRTALMAVVVALLCLGLYALTRSGLALVVVGLVFLAGTASALLLVRLQRAPVPHVSA